MRSRDYLKKIQNLPLVQRKAIFWLVIIILTSILVFLFIKNAQQNIKVFPKEKAFEEMSLPNFKEELENLPEPEIPGSEIEEDLKKLEEIDKETE